MGDLPGELGAVPLVDQPQVGCGMTAPSRGLGLTIALGVARYRQMGQGDFFRRFFLLMSFQGDLSIFLLPNLKEISHRLCVSVVGLSLALHYHDLPGQVPGNNTAQVRRVGRRGNPSPYDTAL